MARSVQREHFSILVEYDPRYSVEQREQVDRSCVSRLAAEKPGFRVVEIRRKLISDHRATLYATLEAKS